MVDSELLVFPAEAGVNLLSATGSGMEFCIPRGGGGEP